MIGRLNNAGVTLMQRHSVSASEQIRAVLDAERDEREGEDNALVTLLKRDRWEPDMVARRISRGLFLEIKTGGGVGPGRAKGFFPDIEITYADRVGYEDDPEWKADAQAAQSADLRRVFTRHDVSLAEEALGWPARYLADPLLLDGLWLVCLARAIKGYTISDELERRRDEADAMVDIRAAGCWYLLGEAAEPQPTVIRIFEDEAAQIAAESVAHANAAMGAPLREKLVDDARRLKRARLPRAERKRLIKRGELPILTPKELAAIKEKRDRAIRQTVEGLFRKRALAEGAVEIERRVSRRDVMPGRHFNLKPAYNAFNRAVLIIAEALDSEGVEIR